MESLMFVARQYRVEVPSPAHNLGFDIANPSEDNISAEPIAGTPLFSGLQTH